MSFLGRFWNKRSRKYDSDRDRRRYYRLKEYHLIRYKISGKDHWIRSFTRDICPGGIKFHSKDSLPERGLIDLEMSFPKYSTIITATARVIRLAPLGKVGGFNVGVQFIEIEEEAKEFINNKILSLSGGKGK